MSRIAGAHFRLIFMQTVLLIMSTYVIQNIDLAGLTQGLMLFNGIALFPYYIYRRHIERSLRITNKRNATIGSYLIQWGTCLCYTEIHTHETGPVGYVIAGMLMAGGIAFSANAQEDQLRT